MSGRARAGACIRVSDPAPASEEQPVFWFIEGEVAERANPTPDKSATEMVYAERVPPATVKNKISHLAPPE